MFKKILFLFVVMLGLIGCSRKKNTQIPNLKKINKKNIVALVRQQDLPIPAGYKIKEHANSKNAGRDTLLFVYTGPRNFAQVINFYKIELEVGGWAYSDLSTKNEGLLIASKSFSNCAVSVRPLSENSSAIHLFILKKQGFFSNSNNSDSNNINLSKINNSRKIEPKSDDHI